LSPSQLSDFLTNCDNPSNSFCPDRYNNRQNYEGNYVGHDEPALLFYSKKKGSGSSSFYTLRLPKDPPTQPKQDGTGGVYNFQLHPAFWFGMALCDTQSSPNPDPQGTCNPSTDDNIFDNPDPGAKDYIGKHPGGAFLELQFYPPGWIGSPGLASSTKWLAALTATSLSINLNTLQGNNRACRSRVGDEPQNFANITTDGIPFLPANPLRVLFGNFNPSFSHIFLMNPGDLIEVSIVDTPAGLKVTLDDVTTGQSGFMIAGPAQGFGREQQHSTSRWDRALGGRQCQEQLRVRALGGKQRLPQLLDWVSRGVRKVVEGAIILLTLFYLPH